MCVSSIFVRWRCVDEKNAFVHFLLTVYLNKLVLGVYD